MVWFAGERRGDPVSKSLIDEGILKMPEHVRLLPYLPNAYVYQKYLREMLPKTGLQDPICMSAYPDFPLVIHDLTKQEQRFLHKAYHFVWEGEWWVYEREHLRKKESGSPDYDPTFQTYKEYSDAFKRKIAIDWCEYEGYEWYEEVFSAAP